MCVLKLISADQWQSPWKVLTREKKKRRVGKRNGKVYNPMNYVNGENKNETQE